MKITIFFISVLLSIAGFAQESKIGLSPSKPLNTLTLDQWTGSDGLISNNLTSINQSQSRFLWLTSFNGILRFDGVSFDLYDKSDLPFLNSNGFYNSYEDSKGNLWFSAQSSGIIKYADGAFHQVLSANGSAHSVRCIAEDDKGNVYVETLAPNGNAARSGKVRLY